MWSYQLYVRTTKYYYFGAQRVAMRQVSTWGENVVYYILGDYLGTTSMVLNADGIFHSEARHYPYGGERWHSGTLSTDYRFTGQRHDAYIKNLSANCRGSSHAAVFAGRGSPACEFADGL